MSIPLPRYHVGDLVPAPVRPGPALARHKHVVLSVREISEGYDKVRVLCRGDRGGPCRHSWVFVHHWGRWL